MPDATSIDPPRSPGRKSRRRLVVSVVALCLIPAVAWLAIQVQRTRRQNVAIAAVHRLRGFLEYEHEALHAPPLPGPDLLRGLIGDDYFVVVSMVSLGNKQATDEAIEPLSGLLGLRELTIADAPLTGSGLAHLHAAKHLRVLQLSNTRFTSANLVHLRAFGALTELSLDGTQVDDAGAVQLVSWPQLEAVNLARTAIDDEGLSGLTRLANLRRLTLDDTAVSDAGLERLAELRQLEALSLLRTHVTAEGVQKLQQSLPAAKIQW
jgi:hypothetical protein